METPDFDWPALTSESGDLPWDAITAAINLLAAQPHRWKEFLDPYNAAQADDDARNFLLLYIPFILGEAAARMPLDPPDGPRREIAEFLLDELQLAYDCGNELSTQELEYACGRHGPAIVPLVLDRLASATLIDAPPAEMWDLLALAAESSDPALRQRVIAACHDLIETARTGHAELVDVIAAIGVLAALRSTASIAPIERFAHDRQEALVEHLLWNDVQAYLREIKGETPHDPDWWHRDPQDFLLTERTFWQDWFANCDASDASEEDVEFDTDDNDDPENSSTLADPDDPFAPDLLDDDDDFSDDTAEPFIPQTPIVNQSPKIGRNDPCPCGSGKKYKKCCGK